MPPRRSLRNRTSSNTNTTEEAIVQPIAQNRPQKKNEPTKRKKTLTKTTKRKSPPKPTQTTKTTKRKSLPKPTQTTRPRPITINLDVTYSSESGDSSDVDEVVMFPPSPNAPTIANTLLQAPSSVSKNTVNGPNNRQGPTYLESSDSDIEEFIPRLTPKIVPPSTNGISFSDSESEDDLYAVHCQEDRLKVFEEVKAKCQEMKTRPEPENSPLRLQSLSTRSRGKTENKENVSELLDDGEEQRKMDDSLDFNLDNIDVSSIVLRGSAGKPRRSKTTKAAIASLQAFSKRFQDDVKRSSPDVNDSFDDDIIIADNFPSSGVSIRVRWGTNYIRHTIQKNFVPLYQELAEEHKVSVSQVVLSFKDSVIAPETRPRDIGLSIGDIIDGGILSPSIPDAEGPAGGPSSEATSDEDMISLKVQTSNRKTVHMLQISKYDKMSVLMSKYSKLRDIPLSKLKFMFDGEILQSSDTPASLDLDGGECIDVFEK